MKGLILAAGKGTRLRPLTDTVSKPLLPLGGQPLISYPLQKLLLTGISEIGIVVGDNEDELRNGLGHIPADVTYIRQDEPRGLAHAVNCAREFCADDDFCLLFCDNLFSEPLNYCIAEWDTLRLAQPEMLAMIHTVAMPDPTACGVAVVDDGWVVELEEKPLNPKSNLAVVGIDILTPRIFDAIARIKPSARGELEITDAINELLVMGHRVRQRDLSGFWYDTGTFSDLICALGPVMGEFGAYQLKGSYRGSSIEGPVGIVRGSQALDSSLSGPVLIGNDCTVTGCTLGPNVSIEAGCTLAGCSLANCQVMPGTRLENASHSGCVIAPEGVFPGTGEQSG